MRILFSAQNFLNGTSSAERSAHIILRKLAKNHEVHVACPGERGTYVWEGITVHERPCFNNNIYVNLFWGHALNRLDIKPELIITQSNAAPPTIFWVKARKIPTIFYVHSFEHFCLDSFKSGDVFACSQRCYGCGTLRTKALWPIYKIVQMRNKKAILQADILISPTNFMKDVIESYSGRVASLVPNPINLEATRVSPRGDAILFVNPRGHKGVGFVAKLVKMLPNRKFVLAGFIERGYERLTWENNVEYMGYVTDMRKAYAKAKVLLAPSSIADPAPTVVYEAMYNGIPCITSDVGAISEAGGDAAIKMSTDDIEGWVHSINRLYDEPDYFELKHRDSLERGRTFSLEKSLEMFNRVVELQLGIKLL
jgi:glycosyltransferase involved in cell wall biosynthesis